MLKRTPIRKKRSKPRRGRLKGDDMTALRKYVFIRDKFHCQHVLRRDESGEPIVICGKEVTWETGHLAHIQARRRGGDSPENTYCCCAEHHLLYHAYGLSMEKPCPPKPLDEAQS